MIRVFDGHSDILSDVTEKILAGQKDVINRHHLERLKKGGTEGAIFVSSTKTIWYNDILRSLNTGKDKKDGIKEAGI